jgi:protection-of-telomeres protein 1
VQVQVYKGCISLLSHRSTCWYIFAESKIPKWQPKMPKMSLDHAMLSSPKVPLSGPENAYVVWLSSFVGDHAFPTAMELEQRKNEASHRRDKYSLFKDLKENNFYDLICEVIRLHEVDGRVSVTLTDYTANTQFYNYGLADEDGDATDTRDGDEYGYIQTSKAVKDWQGPWGKLCLQLTAFDQHGIRFRDEVKPGDWVMLKNVQARIGKSGACLEAALRGDRNASKNKIQVEILDSTDVSAPKDSRWVDAVRRRLAYWSKHKLDKSKDSKEGAKATKRKRESLKDGKTNSKQRRKEKLAALKRRKSAQDDEAAMLSNMNQYIRCNGDKHSAVSVSTMLDLSFNQHKLKNGQDVTAPFSNRKYLVNLRVVDYWPHMLEEFSVGRRLTAYNILDEYDGGESTDNEGDMKKMHEGKGWGAARSWEWRFMLLVEDALPKAKMAKNLDRMWLVVDNEAGQMLFGDDAVSLRQDQSALEVLKDKTFVLWGDLGDKKAELLNTPEGRALRWASNANQFQSAASPPAPTATPGSGHDSGSDSDATPPRLPINMEPPHSDDDAIPTSAEVQVKAEKKPRPVAPPVSEAAEAARKMDPTQASAVLAAKIEALNYSNKGFKACVAQYGIRVKEADKRRADAGDGMRWQRMYKLFGTRII